MLRARIGAATVLGRPGDRRLWVLDAGSAALWDLYEAGLDPTLIGEGLSQRFDMKIEAARSYQDQVYDHWLAAGLLEADALSKFAVEDQLQPIVTFPPPALFQLSPHAWRLTLAEQLIVLQIEDEKLRAIFAPLLKSVSDRKPPAHLDVIPDQAILSGDAHRWRLTINGSELAAGDGWEAALVTTLSALTELGCRTGERLLVVHGAGLVAPDGRCLLLAAPGGFGKSTLAMALEAGGFQLLSDDVVPIRSDGAALGLGLPACIKRGSWGALADCRPDLAQAQDMLRFGQIVRLLSPKNSPVTNAIMPTCLLFPQYRPGAAGEYIQISPEQALRRLVEAEAVIRNLTQEKLEALCRWIGAMPAYALTYPDLANGKHFVYRILENTATPSSR